MRFGPILCVTPFLILAIGADDCFLMLHAWHRVVKKAKKEKSADDSLENRLAETLAESGPSITITAATNILAFTIGALTSPPEIQLFCYANAMAIFVDTEETRWEHRLKEKTSSFLDLYLGELTKTSVSFAVLFLYFGYIAVSIWGVTLLSSDIDTRKFFLKDSVLIEVDRLRGELVIPNFYPVTVFINSPGNLSDSDRIARLNASSRSLSRWRMRSALNPRSNSCATSRPTVIR